MESFLEEVFNLSLMDEPDVLKWNKTEGILQTEEPTGDSHEGEATLERGVTLCQSAGYPGDKGTRGWILYGNQSQGWEGAECRKEL